MTSQLDGGAFRQCPGKQDASLQPLIAVHEPRDLVRELEALYRHRYPQYLRVATAIAGDPASGHDAVQDGFALALRSAKTFRGESTVATWVWRIVTNAARALRTTQILPIEEASSAVAAAETHSENGVGLWVAALPERQRLAVFLRYWADLSYEEIASVLDIEVGTVSATLHKALASLRVALEEVER